MRCSPLLLLLLALGCGGSDARSAPPAAGVGGDELTAFQLEHGIGPVTEPLTLGPLDAGLAQQGKALFEVKCSACHKMEERYVGPPLGGVTARRSPAFIMNQVLNPEGMYARHPVVKQLLGEYMTQMPNLALTREQARQIVEYLRTQAPEEPEH